jgi:hypothetical protein
MPVVSFRPSMISFNSGSIVEEEEGIGHGSQASSLKLQITQGIFRHF